MKSLNEKAREYRLPENTTSEDLGSSWSTVIDFGNKVLLAGYYYEYKKPCYFGAVYEHTDSDRSCEGNIRLTAISDERFEDAGHALQWGMMQK